MNSKQTEITFWQNILQGYIEHFSMFLEEKD